MLEPIATVSTPSAADEPTQPVNRVRSPAVRLVTAIVALVAIVVLGYRAGGYLPSFTTWVETQGALGPAVFIAGYVAATVAAAPGSILTLAAGAIFGVAAGTLYAFVGATIGATAAFLLARYVARGTVESRVLSDRRFAAVDRAVAAEGRKIVFLLRLVPFFPFNLLNYALGLTRVGLGDYVVASVGMLPATLLYVYYGKVIGDVAAVAAGAAPERGTGYYLLLFGGLAAAVAVTLAVTRIARRALRGVTDA